MPRRPLSELRPRDFPKIGDEENAFNSYEDTDDEFVADEVVDDTTAQNSSGDDASVESVTG